MSEARKTMPAKTLLQGAEYVNAASTDIRVRFAQIKAELARKGGTSQLKRKK